MKSEKICWCLSQKKGIRLVEPNDAISQRYLKESSSDFEMIDRSNSKWRTVTAYYSCYNSLYAILAKMGIKCEIHDCTIALMELLGFDASEIDFMDQLKTERVNVQYYLKKPGLSVDNAKVLWFTNKCREMLEDMDDGKIKSIRRELSSK